MLSVSHTIFLHFGTSSAKGLAALHRVPGRLGTKDSATSRMLVLDEASWPRDGHL